MSPTSKRNARKLMCQIPVIGIVNLTCSFRDRYRGRSDGQADSPYTDYRAVRVSGLPGSLG